jgi:hypothetical protein
MGNTLPEIIEEKSPSSWLREYTADTEGFGRA